MLNTSLQNQLFKSKNYRVFLRAILAENRKERGYKKRLADCAGCQAAYFSQVLAERTELTPEHAEKLCRFWDLNTYESEYFFELVNLARAGTASLKERIQKKLQAAKSAQQKQSATFSQPSLTEPDKAALYYSHWLHSAIHVLLTVPGFSTAEALSKHLQRPLSAIVDTLKDLERGGLAIESQGHWRNTQAQIHAAQKDFFAEVHHKNWRLQAMDVQRSGRKNAIRYTSVHTLSKTDFTRIREQIEDLIRTSRQTIEASAEEMAACLLLDYFSL